MLFLLLHESKQVPSMLVHLEGLALPWALHVHVAALCEAFPCPTESQNWGDGQA